MRANDQTAPGAVHNQTPLWLLRIGGFIILLASLGFGPDATLADTPLAVRIAAQYPSWTAVIAEIFIWIIAIGGIIIILLALERAIRAVNKRLHRTLLTRLARMTRAADDRMLRILKQTVLFVTYAAIAGILSLTLWFTLIRLLAEFHHALYLPHYTAQPAIFLLGMLGTVLITGSFLYPFYPAIVSRTISQ